MRLPRSSTLVQTVPNGPHATLTAMLYEAAKQRNPLRWKGPARNWKRVHTVHLNPDQTDNFEPIKRDHRQEQKAA